MLCSRWRVTLARTFELTPGFALKVAGSILEEVSTVRDSVGLISQIGIPGNLDAVTAHPTLSRKERTVSKHGS